MTQINLSKLSQEIKDGAIRPPEVVGSYSVYAKSNKINYVGGKEYKCGKVGHIFRPKIIDSAGTLTQTQPSGTDDVIQPVGYALTDDSMFFNPSMMYFTHT